MNRGPLLSHVFSSRGTTLLLLLGGGLDVARLGPFTGGAGVAFSNAVAMCPTISVRVFVRFWSRVGRFVFKKEIFEVVYFGHGGLKLGCEVRVCNNQLCKSLSIVSSSGSKVLEGVGCLVFFVLIFVCVS